MLVKLQSVGKVSKGGTRELLITESTSSMNYELTLLILGESLHLRVNVLFACISAFAFVYRRLQATVQLLRA